MAIQTQQRIYGGANIATATDNISGLRAIAGTMTQIDIWVKEANTVDDITFHIKKNGVQIGSCDVLQNATHGASSGYSETLADGDEITLDAAFVPSGGITAPIEWRIMVDDGVTSGGDGGGSAFETITWADKVGVSESGGIITKTASGDAYGTAGAASTETIADEGILRYIAGEDTSVKAKIIGLSHENADANYNTVEFGINVGGEWQVYESGTSKGTPSSIGIGSIIEIKVLKDDLGVRAVTYWINGQRVYISSAVPTMPLLVDTAIYHNGGKIGQIEILNGRG